MVANLTQIPELVFDVYSMGNSVCVLYTYSITSEYSVRFKDAEEIVVLEYAYLLVP